LTRIFFDANVIIAASASNRGEAHVLTRLADERDDITLLASEYSWDEAERNLQQHKPDALPKFYELRNRIGIVAEPSEISWTTWTHLCRETGGYRRKTCPS